MPGHPYVGELNRKARELVADARAKEKAGDHSSAGVNLRKAASILRSLADQASPLEEQIRLVQKAKRFESLAEEAAGGSSVFAARGSQRVEREPAADEYVASVDELEYASSVSWDDIGGMEEVKRTLKYTLGTLLASHPSGVNLGISRRLLMYGPPGTGKTLLAAACSNMLGAPFFNVKASNLLSKYFGESTKLISALFARARERAAGGAALIFIDEIDSLSLNRDNDSSGAELRVISTLLAELDGMADKGAGDSVITIAATNKPWAMDEAILQRFQKHVYVGLPDSAAREAIFRVCVEGRGLSIADDCDFRRLADATDMFSGRLIASACNEAVEGMVKELNDNVPDLVDKGQISEHVLKHRPLTWADFERALKTIRPSTRADSLSKFESWAADAGGVRA